ncbi:putative lipid II flippase MurJ [Caldovatus sediminis]|uniref:Probable lipid II flippase MurJ n=1 Tax=Caldovatus sediminis TaxID=2041189 RepID=A0A8J2ZEL7_9PROT|nr:murein biosynthesis integral membrane protein MurJ [Caldovatus sediminis]GGG45870.1 putative lipid II flippase MurJ [Caldovatus sediminis]
MLRSVLTVGGWTMASRVLGFARDMLIAHRLGAGPVADAFFVALQLPNLFRRLFGEGAFNAAFVPAFAGALARQGRAAAQDLAERMAGLLALWLALLTGLGLLFTPQLLAVLVPGFLDRPEKFALTVELARITLPYLWFICLTALVGGVLNGLDRFAAAAAAPVLFNLLSMAALLALTPYVATPAHALAWGVAASGVAQLLLVAIAARQAGMALNLLRRPRLTPPVREVLRRMVPGLIGGGAVNINLFVATLVASLLPTGAVSYLYYADRVGQLPLGVIGAAVGTALLPMLSRHVRGGRPLAAHRATNRAVELSLLFTLPAAAGLAVLAQPIVAALFERGAFDAAATRATVAALVAYAGGLPAFVLVKVFAPGFFARGDTTTPVAVGIGAMAANLLLNLALVWPLAHVGIALATSLAAWGNALALAALLARRRRLVLDRRARRRLPRLAAAAVAMAALLALAAPALSAEAGAGGVARVAALALLVALGAGAYGALVLALGAVAPAELRALLRRRGAGAAAAPAAAAAP